MELAAGLTSPEDCLLTSRTYNRVVHLTSSPLLDEVLAADSRQQRGLLVALVDYLQHRQTSTGVSVNQLAQLTKSRSSANKRRHTDTLERLSRIEDRLRRLDEQVEDLRWLTQTLRVPSVESASGSSVALPQSHRPAAPRPETLLRVERLTNEVDGVDVLKDVNFDVYEGEILGLIGPRDAGKTSLMECLAGLRSHTGGTFLLGDEAPPAWNPKDLIFYLPHNVQPYAELRTLELLESFAGVYEVDSRRWDQIVRRDLSLAPVLGKRVSDLSRANRQRLVLALALMSPQPLLALDEPFDGLDPHQTQALMGILRALRVQSRTLLLSLQQVEEAERMCDRFLLLSAGRLVGVGTLAQLRGQTGLPNGNLDQIFRAVT